MADVTLDGGRLQLWTGDVLEQMSRIPDGSKRGGMNFNARVRDVAAGRTKGPQWKATEAEVRKHHAESNELN